MSTVPQRLLDGCISKGLPATARRFYCSRWQHVAHAKGYAFLSYARPAPTCKSPKTNCRSLRASEKSPSTPSKVCLNINDLALKRRSHGHLHLPCDRSMYYFAMRFHSMRTWIETDFSHRCWSNRISRIVPLLRISSSCSRSHQAAYANCIERVWAIKWP